MGRLICGATMAALVASGLFIGHAVGEGETEPSPRKALATATAAAELASQGDKDCIKALQGAVAALEKEADEAREVAANGWEHARKTASLARPWNRALTLLAYHGKSSKEKYILQTVEVFNNTGITLGMPVGGSWSYSYTKKDQHIVSIVEKAEDGTTLCHVKLWSYKWNTTYSGVGGENAKKLAKMMHELDRDSVAKKGRSASTRVKAVRLNAAFPRVQYYFVRGFDVDEEAELRRRNYYLKDRNRTYCIEMIEYVQPAEGESAITTWLRSEDNPERAAMLASVAEREEDD